MRRIFLLTGKRFFLLMDWPWPSRDIIVAGDFNSVESPSRSLRRHAYWTSREHAVGALDHYIRARRYQDTVGFGGDDDPHELTEFFTYWTKSTASRIDRFYVPLQWTASVQWVEVTEPAVASDHQRVSLILAQDALNDSTTRSVLPIQYPISSQHPEWVRQALLSELNDRNVGSAPSTRTWDDQVLRCVAAIITVRKRSKQRSKRYTSKVQRQTRVDLTSRQQLIHANQVTLYEECLIQEGRRLERTIDCLRWDFKRVSD